MRRLCLGKPEYGGTHRLKLVRCGKDWCTRSAEGPVNALHPFREGNGRAQQAFFEQLAHDAGFTLSWQHLDAARNVEASAAIMRGDAEPMRTLLDALVRNNI